jgi:dihydrofolate synthase / folylpolyglutamate synthase
MSAPASSDAPVEWAAYQVASARITGRIDPEGHADASVAAVRRRAGGKLDQLRRFLTLLGSPQERIPVVHVTGTSGKGSTAAAIASLLSGAGLRTGLLTSPYLQVMTEKLQVNGKLVSGRELLISLEAVEAAERRWIATGNPPLAYGQLWASVALHWLASQALDVAVIEVGAGGRFDLTNIVQPVACVITSVGMDHVATLGPTLADIAWHKAGIIKPGALVVTGALPPEADAAVAAEIADSGATWIPHAAALPVSGGFVGRNRRLALETLNAMAGIGFIDPEAIDPSSIGDVVLPGRLETMPCSDPVVVLDGAHNPDKLRALASELEQRHHADAPGPVILFAALSAKEVAPSLAVLAPHASGFAFTEAAVLGKAAMPASRLGASIRALGFKGPVIVEPDPDAAFDHASSIARDEGAGVVVTGSLYLLGRIRRRWFADPDIVEQQTPWPARQGDASS